MKKAIVLLLALVVVGAFASAQDAAAAPAADQPSYEFTANATGGWTSNLTAGTSTFINDWDLSLKYYLLKDVTKTTAGEGTYGSIEVTHINLRIIEETEDSATVGNGAALWTDKNPDDGISITAKIVSGPIEIGLYGAPSTNYENAKYVPLFDKDAGFDKVTNGYLGAESGDSAFKPTLTGAKGLSLKYTFGDLGSIKFSAANSAAKVAAAATDGALVLKQAAVAYTAAEAVAAGFINPGTQVAWVLADGPIAIGDWYYVYTAGTAAVVAAKAHYMIGADLALNPVKDMIAVTAGGWYDLDTKDMIFSTTAKVTAGDLSVAGALDGAQAGATGSKLAFDASANVAYSLFEKKDSVNLDFYYMNKIAMPTDGFSDLGLKFVDAGGLVEPLSFTLGVFYMDVLDSYKFDPKFLSVAESVSYKVALSDTTYVKPYQALKYDMNDAATAKAGTFFKAGVEASLFANTILTGEFQYGTEHHDMNELLTGGNVSTDSQITFKAKVTL